MTTARELLEDYVQEQLNDANGESWSLTELLTYLNDGLQVMTQYVPREFTTVVTQTLVAGAKQDLPAQGLFIIEVLAAVDSDDSYLDVPFETSKQNLSLGNASWRQAAPGVTEEWAKDPQDPTIYWVSPPAVNNAKLEIEFVQRPATLNINGVLTISKPYEAALADYVLHRAFSKDTDYAGNGGLASLHWNKFLTGVGATDGDA